jgi:hypothetical protein
MNHIAKRNTYVFLLHQKDLPKVPGKEHWYQLPQHTILAPSPVEADEVAQRVMKPSQRIFCWMEKRDDAGEKAGDP